MLPDYFVEGVPQTPGGPALRRPGFDDFAFDMHGLVREHGTVDSQFPVHESMPNLLQGRVRQQAFGNAMPKGFGASSSLMSDSFFANSRAAGKTSIMWMTWRKAQLPASCTGRPTVLNLRPTGRS